MQLNTCILRNLCDCDTRQSIYRLCEQYSCGVSVLLA